VKTEEFGGQPEHYVNASLLIQRITNDVAPKFTDLRIQAINLTDDELSTFPGMLEEAKLQGDPSYLKDLQRDDRETEAASAHQTEVSVSIQGDVAERIQKATDMINNHARKLGGRNKSDSGISGATARRALQKLFGHKPEHEDLPSLIRYLEYIFKS
jgi:hypothetical protein